MAERPAQLKRWIVLGAVALGVILMAAAIFWRDDILRTALDPREPFQTYDPPPAPDYDKREAWALMPREPATWTAEEPAADIFFVGPTTYDGGRHWNAPIDDAEANAVFRRVMAPNYAGPFVSVGRIFAPRYRQASLYSLLTLREDAREARRFAYADVAAAFRYYLAHYNGGRPLVIVGVEQGGTLAARLLAEDVAGDPALARRLAAGYLIETVTPADRPPLPACDTPAKTGCVAAWTTAFEGEIDRARVLKERALVWGEGGQLDNLARTSTPLCFNPLLGVTSEQAAPQRLNLGSANATGLEWGARPAFLTRQVSARCKDGVLFISRPKSPSLKPSGAWADRRRAPGNNAFYANLEADAKRRVEALLVDPSFPKPAAPIAQRVEIEDAPVRKVP